MKSKLCFMLAVVCNSTLVFADARVALREFSATTRSFAADFTQQVIKDGKVSRASAGRLEFVRPNRLRWEYFAPAAQVVVADGTKLWSFDPELNQVTVRDQSALAQTPAAILASDKLEAVFSISSLGSISGVDWLEAKPRAKDSLFASVALGFRGKDLVYLEVKDHFGQVSRVLLSKQEKNKPIATDRLSFVPPRGADVLQQ